MERGRRRHLRGSPALRTESPSRKGSSGLLELGWSKEATQKDPYDLTVRVTGWAGRQKGFTFNTRLNFHI